MAADEAAGQQVRGPAGASRAPASASDDHDRSDRGPETGERPTHASPPGRGSQRFRRTDRLLDRRDFDRVLRKGRRRSSPELVVVTCRRLEPPTRGGRRAARDGIRAGDGCGRGSRIGITVGRKAGGAVERNRFKRRVREWFRRHRDDFEKELDIVVIARRPAVELAYGALGERLGALLPRRSTRNV